MKISKQLSQSHFNSIWSSYQNILFFRLLCLLSRVWKTRCSDNSTRLSWNGIESIVLNFSMGFKWWKEHWKKVLSILLRTCKIVSIKPCKNREDKSRSAKFRYTTIVVSITMNFLAVVTPLHIYHGWSTWKMFWEEKFPLVNMASCERINVRKHK